MRLSARGLVAPALALMGLLTGCHEHIPSPGFRLTVPATFHPVQQRSVGAFRVFTAAGEITAPAVVASFKRRYARSLGMVVFPTRDTSFQLTDPWKLQVQSATDMTWFNRGYTWTRTGNELLLTEQYSRLFDEMGPDNLTQTALLLALRQPLPTGLHVAQVPNGSATQTFYEGFSRYNVTLVADDELTVPLTMFVLLGPSFDIAGQRIPIVFPYWAAFNHGGLAQLQAGDTVGIQAFNTHWRR